MTEIRDRGSEKVCGNSETRIEPGSRGTSEWSAQEITEAWKVAEKLNMIGPAMDQTQYNLMERARVSTGYGLSHMFHGVMDCCQRWMSDTCMF
jgi:hypothetical protein